MIIQASLNFFTNAIIISDSSGKNSKRLNHVKKQQALLWKGGLPAGGGGVGALTSSTGGASATAGVKYAGVH